MNKEQILEEQVKALEKLLGFKDEIIKQLEKKLAEEKAKITLPISPPKPDVYGTYPNLPLTSITSCVHEYGPLSGGLSDAFQKCKKCGQYNSLIMYTNNG